LEKITSQNFRTLEEISISFSSEYCTVSGQNNSGKSNVFRIIRSMFGVSSSIFAFGDDSLTYNEDVTKWKNGSNIETTIEIEICSLDDSGICKYISRIVARELTAGKHKLLIKYTYSPDEALKIEVSLDGEALDADRARDVDRRLKQSRCVEFHNSPTNQSFQMFSGGRSLRVLHGSRLSDDERKEFASVSDKFDKGISKILKGRAKELAPLMGRLGDNHEIELSHRETSSLLEMPLSINIRDKSLTVPLLEWGSGTQNKTQLLMALFQAAKAAQSSDNEERITPIFIVEEPESYLHPSAQAEFGRLLQQLSGELNVQLIIATHSPFMLNTTNPSANILLTRTQVSGKRLGTCVVDTNGEKWMSPFADHLGVSPTEFTELRSLFQGARQATLFVEGETEVRLFEHFKSHPWGIVKLDSSIRIVPYGGKNTLRNNRIVRFMIDICDRAFITFDLDALDEVKQCMTSLLLKPTKDYLTIGIDQTGRRNIEGLYPQVVLSAVFQREPDLVMAKTSNEKKERDSADSSMKKLLADEFIRGVSLSETDLQHFDKLLKIINKALVG
jgi:putative ATP-dependent endonuclease of the OLD family